MTLPGSTIPSRRGYYHGWNIVGACILSQVAVNGIAVNCFSLFLPGWVKEFGAPPSQLLLAIAFETLVGSSLAPLIGGLADRFPARVLFGIGLAGNAVFALSLSFVTQAWHIVAMFGLLLPLPIVMAAAVPANSLISRWFVRRIGVAVGFCSFGMAVAGVMLPPLVSHFLPIVGWRHLWQINAAVCLLVILPIVMLIMRNRPDEHRDGLHYLIDDSTGSGKSAAEVAHKIGGPSTVTYMDVFRRKNFWLLIGIVMPILAVDISMMQNIAPYAISKGFTAQQSGWFISVMFGAHVIAAVVIGWTSDRFGPRPSLAGLVVMSVAGALLLAYSDGFAGVMLGCVFVGIIGAVFTMLPIGTAREFGQAGFGRAFGCSLFFLPIPVFSGALFAKTQEITGSYVTSLLGVAALMVIPATLLLFYQRKPAEPEFKVALEA